MDLEPMAMPQVGEPPSAMSRLHGKKPPVWDVLTEQPWHRLAAFLFCQGATTADISRELEVSPVTVGNLLRQTWFQEHVTKLMSEHGGKDIIALFKAEQFNSLCTLIEIRDSAKTPATVRVKCATDILDRALGRAVQRIETQSIPTSSDPVQEAKQIEMQISHLQQKR